MTSLRRICLFSNAGRNASLVQWIPATNDAVTEHYTVNESVIKDIEIASKYVVFGVSAGAGLSDGSWSKHDCSVHLVDLSGI